MEEVIQTRWTAAEAIAHHGIKGMHWGVRRFQNEDGSLTPAGEQRYGVNGSPNKSAEGQPNIKKKSKFRQKLEGNYYNTYKNKYGLSDEEARKKAEGRYELTKKVAIGAGIAIGGVVAYKVAKNVGMNYLDKTIKSGKMMQNLSESSDIINSGHAFYTSYRAVDNMKYRGLFGEVNIRKNKNINQLQATKDLKIASTRNAKKVYENLLKNDKEFANVVGNGLSYEEFNKHGLMMTTPEAETAKKKFYGKLKEAGYAGVHDWNDRNASGFNTKANIIFDATNVVQKSSKELSKKQQAVEEKIAAGMIYTDAIKDVLITPSNVTTGAAIAGLLVTGNYDARVKNEALKQRKAEEDERKKTNQNSKSNK